MADRIYSATIDITRINKNKLFKGEKGDGIYLSVRLIVNDEADQWGKHVLIYQNQTEEESQIEGKQKPLGKGVLVAKNGIALNRKVTEEDLNDFPF